MSASPSQDRCKVFSTIVASFFLARMLSKDSKRFTKIQKDSNKRIGTYGKIQTCCCLDAAGSVVVDKFPDCIRFVVLRPSVLGLPLYSRRQILEQLVTRVDKRVELVNHIFCLNLFASTRNLCVRSFSLV
jgi:hypothetical protein